MSKREVIMPWGGYPKNMGECKHLGTCQNRTKCKLDSENDMSPCDWTPEGCHIFRPYTEQEEAKIKEGREYVAKNLHEGLDMMCKVMHFAIIKSNNDALGLAYETDKTCGGDHEDWTYDDIPMSRMSDQQILDRLFYWIRSREIPEDAIHEFETELLQMMSLESITEELKRRYESASDDEKMGYQWGSPEQATEDKSSGTKDDQIIDLIVKRGMRNLATYLKYLSNRMSDDGFRVYKEYRLDGSASSLCDTKVGDLSLDNKLQLILHWLRDPVVVGVYNERNAADDILDLIDDEPFERRVIRKYFKGLHIALPEEEEQ